MRLWTVHPRHLDRQGLLACWRESLLAQAVLHDPSRGYSRHPQLIRFRAHSDPAAAIRAFLLGLQMEATVRGYRFDASRILDADELTAQLPATDGQLAFEWQHLMAKLHHRSPALAQRWSGIELPEAHPVFSIVPGPVESWERGAPAEGTGPTDAGVSTSNSSS